MRISDWSSDVCSSDLFMHVLFIIDPLPALKAYKDSSVAMMRALVARGHTLSVAYQRGLFIDRKSVVSGKSVSVGVDIGGRRHLKNKTQRQQHRSEDELKSYRIMNKKNNKNLKK